MSSTEVRYPADSGVPVSRIRIDLSYDGTDFSGWAPQPDRRTVAGVVGEALATLFGEVRGLTAAGRTDAGVHATGQVCHADVPTDRWHLLGDSAVRRLAVLLPTDVRVRSAVEVPSDFDARFSALYRRYEYRVTDAPWGAEPLVARYTLAWPRPLELSRLDAASAGLLGVHDFAAYCRRKPYGTTIRTLHHLSWRRDADGVLVASVAADAFCQAMVRSLVGALLAVGDGRRSVTWPAELLGRIERAGEVVVAPPHGLTLVEVGYPADPAEYAVRATQTRNRRA